MTRLWTLALAALLVSPVQAQSAKPLWVLQEPGQIVEYDASTFAARRTMNVPRRLLEHPEYLTVNPRGQMLFLPPRGVQWAGGEMASTADRVWFWDGRQADEWPLESQPARGTSGAQPILVETTADWFLSAGGDWLVVLETRFEKIVSEPGVERSVRTTSRILRTDLARSRSVTITSLPSSGWCACATGVCSETCPEWSFWAPDGVVGDVFLVTRVTPGQIGSTYHEGLLYQRSGQQWRATKLPGAVQQPLAASSGGEILIGAVLDGGCCGWENEGSDRMLLLRGGTVTVLYDELGRYDNRNYDVSFFPSNARLSPGKTMLAYTIASTAQPGAEIRLSSSGKEAPRELTRIRTAMAELPSIEILRLGVKPRRTAVIRHAVLVGWLNDGEILIAQDGRLSVYDVQTGKQRQTPIRVRTGADAFLR